MDTEKKREIAHYLANCITAEKWQKMQVVAHNRTKYITVVLENIHQELNTSAALRSIECFGLQEASIIDTFQAKTSVKRRVTKGSEQWLNLKRYRGSPEEATQRCFDELKDQGYLVVATMPHAQGQLIHELPLNRKIALVFGSEIDGISDYAQKNADAFAAIPMYGFTQSFNVAASVGMCLYDVVTRLRASDYPWRPSEQEVVEMCYTWIKKMVRQADLIEKCYSERALSSDT